MSLRALAFGPLPRSQVQASQRLSLPSSSGSSMSGGGGGEFDAPMAGGGPMLRQPEGFNPVFPDLFGAEAPPAAPDFTSPIATDLSGLTSLNKPTVTPAAGEGIDAQAFQPDDMTKALKSLQQGLKLGKSGKELVDWLGTSGYGGGSVDFSAGAPGAEVSGGELALGGDALGSGVSGGSSAASGLSGGAGYGAALTALLGLLAASTGNAELGKAAQALGGASSIAGTAGAGITAATGGATGLGGAAALGFAPVGAGLLIGMIGQMLHNDDIPFQIAPKPDPYQLFNEGLFKNEGQQGKALRTLAQALPYAQSQEELGQLVNTYRQYAQTTQDAPLADWGGDPYRVTTIPGTGPVTHGTATPAVDWGGQTQQLQGEIDALLSRLPGAKITAGYDQPGGLPEGPDAMRLWTQFLDREQTAPVTSFGGGSTYTPPGGVGEAGSGWSGNELPGAPKGLLGLGDLGQYAPTSPVARYGQSGYDYAGSGYPEPGQYVGTKSSAWENLTMDQVLRALMGGTSG